MQTGRVCSGMSAAAAPAESVSQSVRQSVYPENVGHRAKMLKTTRREYDNKNKNFVGWRRRRLRTIIQ